MRFHRYRALWWASFGVLAVAAAVLAPAILLLSAVVMILRYCEKRRSAFARCVAYFALLGPLVGFIGLTLATRAQDGGLVFSGFFESLLFGAVFGVALWALALLFGGVPASATGIVYWACRRQLKGIGWRIALPILAGPVGAALSALWVNVALDEEWHEFIVAGGIAAVVCGTVSEWRIYSGDPQEAA